MFSGRHSRTFARAVLQKSVQRLISQCIKPCSLHVLLELFVPGSGIKAQKPFAKVLQFITRKFADSRFDFFDRAHTCKIRSPLKFRQVVVQTIFPNAHLKICTPYPAVSLTRCFSRV